MSDQDVFLEFFEEWSELHRSIQGELSILGKALARVTQVKVASMNVVDNALPPGAPFKSTEGLAGKIYLVPADKKHPPILFQDMPAAKEMLAFIYKRASVRFNYNEIYAKIVNYKFEAKEKALNEAETAQAEKERALFEEDEL